MVTESVYVSLVGGTCSGIVCTLLYQPLDLLKTQLQTKNIRQLRDLHVLLNRKSIKYESLKKAWVGVTPSLYRTIPGVALYFSALSQLKKLHGEELNKYSAVALGALARTMTISVTQPFTLIKTRFESGTFGYKSVVGALINIWRVDRTKGLYRGFVSTVLRDAPFSGIYLGVYHHIKSVHFSDTTSLTSTVTAGLLAGSTASLLTHPADTIKTSIQTHKGSQVQTIRSTCAALYNDGGVEAFYRGYFTRVLRRTLVSATAWIIYESVLKAMNT